MASLKELFTSSKAGAADLIPQHVAKTIISEAEKALIARKTNLVWVYNLTDSNAVKFVVQAKEGVKAKWIPEGGEIPIDTAEYSNINVTPDKMGIRPVITREMVEDSQWDMIDMQLRKAGVGMARLEDSHCFSIAISCANTVAPSASDAITPTYDFATAMNNLEQNDYNADAVYCSPHGILAIRRNSSFYTDSIFGQPEGGMLAVGFAGSIFGMDVFVTNHLQSGCWLFVDRPARPVVLVERRPITTEQYSDPIQGLAGMSVTARLKAACLLPSAMCTITGAYFS